GACVISAGFLHNSLGGTMSLWRSPFPDVDTAPAMVHDEVLGGAAPGRVAVVDAATGGSLTYAELLDRATRLAGGLRRCGARRGDVLSVITSNAPDFPVVAYGALLSGLTLAPASPLLTGRELTAFLRQIGARYVVADAGAMPKAAEAGEAAGAEML